jgi:hypothetical protein
MKADRGQQCPEPQNARRNNRKGGLIWSKREGNQGHYDQKEDQRQTKPAARPYR